MRPSVLLMNEPFAALDAYVPMEVQRLVLARLLRRRRLPSDIQRGMFAGEVGSPRLLTLLNREEIASTWFIPGHSLETFPEQMAAVAASGHEIGAHGYSHENPIALTEQQERDVMGRSVELITAPGHPVQPGRQRHALRRVARVRARR
jgi:peptidoglycan/xylan/chitin deacetylase (PgdA/CDA1 family)